MRSIRVDYFSIHTGALAFFNTNIAVQPLSFRAMTSVSAGRITTGIFAVEISAIQWARRSTFIVHESSWARDCYGKTEILSSGISFYNFQGSCKLEFNKLFAFTLAGEVFFESCLDHKRVFKETSQELRHDILKKISLF